LGTATSPPFTAENGLARCVCNAHFRQVQSLGRQYATSAPQYHIDARNFAQLRHRPHWLEWDAPHLPQISPFPFDDLHSHLVHLSLDRPTHHFKRHPDLISRFSTIHPSERPTDRPTDGLGETLLQHLLMLYCIDRELSG